MMVAIDRWCKALEANDETITFREAMFRCEAHRGSADRCECVRGRTVASEVTRHLPPRKVRAPWAGCQVTPGRNSVLLRRTVPQKRHRRRDGV